MPGSGRTARMVMLLVAAVVILGLLASTVGTAALVGQ
jgi:hypothetical protein